MQTLIRVVVIAAIVAIPVIGLNLMDDPEPPGRAAAGGSRRPPEPSTPPYEPTPLPRRVQGDGLTFATAAGDHDVRGFRQLALYVPEGEAAADFLPAGLFTATFVGRLVVPSRDRYWFTFVGTGTFELVIGDQEVLVRAEDSTVPATGRRLRLKKGEHPFVARYQSPAAGPAALRVYWQSRDFAREPIPAAALRHEVTPDGRAYGRLRRGRELVRELRCGACHAGALSGRGAPPLADVGGRLRVDWMARWIADPRALRPTATMPRVLHGAAAADQARDIATYLSTLGRPQPGPGISAADRQAGAEIFADYGCIACHTLPGAATAPADVAGRIDLSQVRAKWHPAALVEFLRQPTARHPAIRMPDFRFTADQARFVAGFLLARSVPEGPAVGVGDAERGKALIAEKGCATCHGIAVGNRLRAPERAATRSGAVVCTVADYGLTGEDEAALRSFLTRNLRGSFTAVEAAEREYRQQRCAACHGRQGEPAVLARVADEVADLVPPDPTAPGGAVVLPPDLTHAGAKLQTPWLTAWLDGEMQPRPRPWIAGPMPVFRLDSATMAAGLAHAHGFPASGAGGSLLDGMAPTAATAPSPDYLPEPAPAAELRRAGAGLLPQDGGFGCDTCHAVGESAAQQVFEAPGPNLNLAAKRLRKEYFLRWLWDPTRVDSATKMTRFIDADGQSGLTDVLGGSGAAQVEALWRYLHRLE